MTLQMQRKLLNRKMYMHDLSLRRSLVFTIMYNIK